MPVARKIPAQLAGFATAALAGVSGQHIEPAAVLAWSSILGGLAGAVIQTGVGPLADDYVHDLAERFRDERSARHRENRELHRLIGETAAFILEKPAEVAPGGSTGLKFLRSGAEAFRGKSWMQLQVSPAPPGAGDGEDAGILLSRFSGHDGPLRETCVLEQSDCEELVRAVAGRAHSADGSEALSFAATQLRQRFAAELCQSAKLAWRSNDLAWPALLLRLVGAIQSNATKTGSDTPELRVEIRKLHDAVLAHAEPVLARADANDLLAIEIRNRSEALIAILDRIEVKIDVAGVEVRGPVDDRKPSPVVVGAGPSAPTAREAVAKRPCWIDFPDTSKEILARDREAGMLLRALRADGPGVVGIAAPPGFGKTSVLAVAVRSLRGTGASAGAGDGDAPENEIQGIAVLDARTELPNVDTLGELAVRITRAVVGAGPSAPTARVPLMDAKIKTEAADDGAAKTEPLGKFFTRLRECGNVVLVVENAEAILAPEVTGAKREAFQDLLRAWSQHDHRAKLLLLSRVSVWPEGHLVDLEKSLEGGLPLEAAVAVLRQRLSSSRFAQAQRSLLEQIAEKLHRVPMALEQFAGYLIQRDGVELDQSFVDQSELLRLDKDRQLRQILREKLKALDSSAAHVLRIVAWATVPIPSSAIPALVPHGATATETLVRAGLLPVPDGNDAEGQFFRLHPLCREAVAESVGGAREFGLDLEYMGRTLGNAAREASSRRQWQPALADYTLVERIARSRGDRAQLAAAQWGRAFTLCQLGRLEEALAVYAESIAILRALIEKGERRDWRSWLAATFMNRAITFQRLGRLKEALGGYSEAVSFLRQLVETERRRDLRNDLAAALMGKGIALVDLGRPDEGLPRYDEAIAIRRQLVETEGRRDLRNDLAAAVVNRANTLKSLGRLEEALAGYGEAVAIRRELVETDGRRELRNDLAAALMGRAITFKELGKLGGAVAGYEEAIAIRRELVETEGRRELRNDLAAALMGRAIALSDLGRLEESLEGYDEGIAIRRELVETEGRRELRDDLAAAVINRANTLKSLGGLEEALAGYDEAIGIRETLVESEGRNELSKSLSTARELRSKVLQESARHGSRETA